MATSQRVKNRSISPAALGLLQAAVNPASLTLSRARLLPLTEHGRLQHMIHQIHLIAMRASTLRFLLLVRQLPIFSQFQYLQTLLLSQGFPSGYSSSLSMRHHCLVESPFTPILSVISPSTAITRALSLTSLMRVPTLLNST